MSYKHQISDYEPVTRPKGKRDSRLEDVEAEWTRNQTVWPESSDITPKPPIGANDPAPNAAMASRAKTAKEARWTGLKETWIVKRGHSISFLGLYLFTFLVFFRPYEWTPSLSWLSSSAYWIANFTLAVFIPTQLGLENKITSRPREVNLVLLLFLACLLSIPLATDPTIAWNGVNTYIKVVIMFIVMVNVVRTEKRMKALLFMVLVGSCVLSISAINDFRLGRLGLNGQRIEGVIGGLFDNPNDLALHLVTMLPLAVALLLGTRTVLMKVFYAACVILAMGGVVATFSRGGFLGMMCAGGVLAWRLARHNKLLIPIVLSFLVVVMVALAPSGYGSRLRTTSDGSAQIRSDDLKHSLLIAARHPVFGVGFDNYFLYSNTEHASHNAYTQVASELGLTAAAIYILFLVVPIRQLRRISYEEDLKQHRSRIYYLSVGLEASLVGYMVSSFFASVAFLWYAYYLVAYAICLRRLHDTERPITTQQVSTAPGIEQAFKVS